MIPALLAATLGFKSVQMQTQQVTSLLATFIFIYSLWSLQFKFIHKHGLPVLRCCLIWKKCIKLRWSERSYIFSDGSNRLDAFINKCWFKVRTHTLIFPNPTLSMFIWWFIFSKLWRNLDFFLQLMSAISCLREKSPIL